MKYQSMKVPVSFRTRYAMADKRILVDSGATDNFIHLKFVKRLHVGMQELEHPIKIWNIDGMANKARKLTHFVNLLVQTKKCEEKMRFLVTDLGIKDVILGYPQIIFHPLQANTNLTKLFLHLSGVDYVSCHVQYTILC